MTSDLMLMCAFGAVVCGLFLGSLFLIYLGSLILEWVQTPRRHIQIEHLHSRDEKGTLDAGTTALVAAVVLGVAGLLIVAFGGAARGIETDTTDNKVSKPEARYTYVGEQRSDIRARIGPVDRHGNCAPGKARCVVEYRLYTPWECWRVVYHRLGVPFTARTVGPLQVDTWTMRYHPDGCLS